MDDPQWTRRDPGVTSRDVPGPRHPGESLVRLPGALAHRFQVVGELPVQGAESDLLLVRDGSGEYVVKIYRRGYHADREVWAMLPRLASANIVRILETGHSDNRDYEVIEYLPEGNLRGLMTRSIDIREVVRQLAEGLRSLHDAGIVHRDLKPENVLVRGPQLVITDFGLSKVIEQSVVFASSSRTLAYAAPESLSGQVSPARDWWSLGMMARELVTGRPPFDGMSETVVVDHLATRAIGNDDITDPALRQLCEGLLTRDPRRRWSYTQVQDWLNGVPVPAVVAPDPHSDSDSDPQSRPDHRQEGLRELWTAREARRRQGLNGARVRAVLWTLPLLGLWIAGSFAVDALFGGGKAEGTASVGGFQKASGTPLGFMLLTVTGAWLLSCAAELLVAQTKAGDYLNAGPWGWLSVALTKTGSGLSRTSRAMSSTAQRTGARGCGLAIVAAAIPLLMVLLLISVLSSLAWMLWLIMVSISTIAHIIGAGIRVHHWRGAQAAAERAALA
ncbi:MAG: serine/threonine-protein kinase [Streptosporangiaceae bacterium]